ncbi:hypothetical protein ACFZB9_07035 [Kitasatospora sp. NPDC008050]|uniref:hypothetical protein n=1 Tax=Kitasatospora sp. NPDC008050 TaxID=3364021 RepID=UPI0036E727FF
MKDLPRDDESIVQLARHRVIYEIALVFYGVLTALALTEPLMGIAKSISSRPEGTGLPDWTMRLLVLTVLIQAAIWLHHLAVVVELHDTRHGKKRYGTAILVYWSGVVMVVILMVMGAAVGRGATAFLTASIAYMVWSLLLSVVVLPLQDGSLWTWPWSLLKELNTDRKRWKEQGPTRPTAARTRDLVAIYSVQESALGLVFLSLLAFWARQAHGPGWHFAFALTWLLIVLGSVVYHYWSEPWFYGL